MDNDAAIRHMAERSAMAEALIQASEAAQRRGRLVPPERLVVVVSNFYGSRWKHLSSAGAKHAAEASVWHEGAGVLQGVLAAVEDL